MMMSFGFIAAYGHGVTADGQAIPLTSDHSSYPPMWQP
jgi:hypothetical protein